MERVLHFLNLVCTVKGTFHYDKESQEEWRNLKDFKNILTCAFESKVKPHST